MQDQFTQFMIEIWQWEIINGQVTMKKDSEYISKERLKDKFNTWKKK